MNNDITCFYLDVALQESPTYSKVINADYEWLEECHSWIQRAFPNYEESVMVPDSPVLDDETLDFLQRTCKEKIMDLVFKYLTHYGSITHQNHIYHNNLRVTRLLKFLSLLGYNDMKNVVYKYCSNHLLHNIGSNDYNLNSIRFWNDALNYRREQ